MSTIEQTLNELSQKETVSLKTLGIQAEAISLESNDKSFVNAESGYLRNFLSGVAAVFEKITPKFKDQAGKVDWDKISRIKHTRDYKSIRTEVIKVPAGFKGNYFDFIALVNNYLDNIEALDKDLSTTIGAIAQYNSNPEKLLAQSAASNFRGMSTLTYADLEKIQSFFTRGGKTDAMFGEVLHSVSELEHVVKGSEELRKRTAKINFSSIDAKVKRLTELVLKLNKQIADKPELSGAAATALSTVLKDLAVTVTISALIAEAVAGTVNALAMSVEVL